MTETSLHKGTRTLVDHPLTKLFERIAIGVIAFLSVWMFNKMNDVQTALPMIVVRIEQLEKQADNDRVRIESGTSARVVLQQEVVQRLTRLETQGEATRDEVRGVRDDLRNLSVKLDQKRHADSPFRQNDGN
jgi:hypothetical protein